MGQIAEKRHGRDRQELGIGFISVAGGHHPTDVIALADFVNTRAGKAVEIARLSVPVEGATRQ